MALDLEYGNFKPQHVHLEARAFNCLRSRPKCLGGLDNYACQSTPAWQHSLRRMACIDLVAEASVAANDGPTYDR